MVGDKVGDGAGKVTGQRVLPNLGGGPKVETSFQAAGTLLGVAHTTRATYQSVMRPDGTLYGEGNGVVMSPEGDMASWVGQGVGTLKKDGAVSFRGAVYFQTMSVRWSRLNGVATIYEYEVDAQGGTHAQFWEWK